ncbi:MAG: ABC transporter substrate-binding protein [Spirochaetaceae bacterium]|nr:ABC transporter substrate-binding protein [Spirochaetaceae bacterium]
MCGSWLLILLLFISGCGAAKSKEITNRASVNTPGINRIISAAPSYTEIIAGLGLADRLIAVDKYSRDIEGVRADLPEIDFFYPDIEAIAELQPDIIISGEINTNGSADTPFNFFRRINITVLELSTCNSIAEIYRDIAAIANALGAGERGEALIFEMKTQIEAIAANAQNIARSTGANRVTSVYFEIAPAPNMISFGGNTYLNEMIEITGARNIFAGEKRWFTPGAEAIISANPDVIFILSGNAAETEFAVAELKNRPGFTALNAVRQNRIYPIDANSASRSSQNITAALEEMCRAMYYQ